jgi:hypothetical protein
MARSDRIRALARLVALCAVAGIAACTPRLPLEKLRCPCLADEGFVCCQTEQICYLAAALPPTCTLAGVMNAGDGGAAVDTDAAADGGGDGGAAVDTDAAADGGGAAVDTDAAADGGGDGGAAVDTDAAADGGGDGDGHGRDAGAGGAAGSDAGAGGSGGTPPSDERPTADGFFLPPPAILSTGPWLFTTSPPAGDWMRPGFDTAGWWPGQPGFFGDVAAPGDNPQTWWPAGASDLWLRTTFRIDQADVPRALLWGRWDDTIEVYVNGVRAATDGESTPGYRYLGLKGATLVPGALNTLAVHARDVGGDRYLDVAIAVNEAMTQLPMSGSERTLALTAYTTAVRRFMHERGIPGGVLAVMKKDQVVVARGFGWADKAFTRPMPADAVMRLAAPDVLLTTGAVATLIDGRVVDPVTREVITRDTRVFPLLRAHGLTPLPGRTPGPEIDAVTVGMLLSRTSGVSELPADPARIYADVGVPPGTSLGAEDNVRWVYSMSLVNRPGAVEADRFTGYMVLRHLVHVVTGDLLGFLRSAVFAPAGSSDVFIAHEPLALRDRREPGYLTLEAPYDRWLNLDNVTTLASTAEAFVRYLRRYHASEGTRLVDLATGQWAAVPDNGTLIFYGAMPGTWTNVVQRRYDEVSYAVFFNITGPYHPLFDQLQAITNSLTDSDWGI